MNKLNTSFNAAVPVDWDDFAWMQDGIRDALYGLLSAFGIDPDESFILSGCAVTVGPTSATAAAGYLSLNGEILKVEAQTISYDGSSPLVWRLSETNDSKGAESDSNGNTVQCYQKRVAVLYQASSYTGEMAYDANTLMELIESVLGLNTGWTTVPYNAAYFTGTNLVLDSTKTSLYYKVIGKTMHIGYSIGITSMDQGVVTIDVASATGYSIVKQIYGSAILKESSNNGPLLVTADNAIPQLNHLVFTTYNEQIPVLSSGVIYGQITIEVLPV